MTGFWEAVASTGPYTHTQISTLTPHHSIITVWMLFLTSNQQCQSTQGTEYRPTTTTTTTTTTNIQNTDMRKI